MRIIQSYAKNDYESPYVLNLKDSSYINFYSFLLSYITLKKQYGSVTMFTNKKGYDSLIKFIPYDNVEIKESNNDINYWSYYKVEVIKTMNEDVIHVDSDVFIFNDLFRPFFQEDYDIIVQDVFSFKRNTYMAGGFVKKNINKLNNMNLINKISGTYDMAYSCGVIGLKERNIKKYISISETLKSYIEKSLLDCEENFKACVSEEVALYITAMKHNFKTFSVLPYEETSKNENDLNSVANRIGYTHLWFNNKFKKSNVDLIKNKIKNNYSEYYDYVVKYENFLDKNNIKLNYA